MVEGGLLFHISCMQAFLSGIDADALSIRNLPTLVETEVRSLGRARGLPATDIKQSGLGFTGGDWTIERDYAACIEAQARPCMGTCKRCGGRREPFPNCWM